MKLTEDNNWSVDHNDTTLTVLLYQTHYGIAPLDVNDAWNSCQRPCREVGIIDGQDGNAAASADVVTINMLRSQNIPWTRPPNQILVGIYFESPGHHPFQIEE